MTPFLNREHYKKKKKIHVWRLVIRCSDHIKLNSLRIWCFNHFNQFRWTCTYICRFFFCWRSTKSGDLNKKKLTNDKVTRHNLKFLRNITFIFTEFSTRSINQFPEHNENVIFSTNFHHTTQLFPRNSFVICFALKILFWKWHYVYTYLYTIYMTVQCVIIMRANWYMKGNKNHMKLVSSSLIIERQFI